MKRVRLIYAEDPYFQVYPLSSLRKETTSWSIVSVINQSFATANLLYNFTYKNIIYYLYAPKFADIISASEIRLSDNRLFVYDMLYSRSFKSV